MHTDSVWENVHIRINVVCIPSCSGTFAPWELPANMLLSSAPRDMGGFTLGLCAGRVSYTFVHYQRKQLLFKGLLNQDGRIVLYASTDGRIAHPSGHGAHRDQGVIDKI